MSTVLLQPRSIPYKWLVASAFVAGLFMDLMDATIVNVALPTLAKEFNATNSTLEWVVNGYLLSLAIWIPASGWIGDKFGTKRTFLFALSMFTVGSFLCSLAWSIESLIAFRVLQGIGGGMMTPVGTAMLFRAFPTEERAMASSVLAIPTALAPALGPVLGGWLVDYAEWQWIFRVNVPIGIAALIFSLFFLQEHREAGAGNFDVGGFVLSGSGLVLFLYCLSTGVTRGWGDPLVLGSGILGIVLLVTLVFFERRHKNPLLHFSLFQDRLFRSTNLIMFFAYAVWLGFLFILPLFLQQLRGLSAFESGLTTFPQAVGWIVMSFFASRIYLVMGPRKMITIGLTGVMITSFLFVFFTTETDLWTERAIMFVRGVCMAFAVIPIQAAAFSNIPSAEAGRASSLFNTNRQIASSFGVALLGTVLFQVMRSQSDQLFAYQVTFVAATLLGLVAVFFATKIQDKDAAASLKLNPQYVAAD